MKSFKLGGDLGNLLYHDIPGAGRPLIVVHGLGCASSCDYPRVACDPAMAGRRMVLVDLLGFGFSDRPAGFGYTIDDHAQTLAELISASLIAGGKPTWRELLLGMTMPRTLIFGENSLPDEDTQNLPHQGITISVVPQAGHSMAWENPAGLAGAMQKALS